MLNTLRAKIYAGFAAIIAVNVVVGIWALYRFSNVGTTFSQTLSVNAEIASQVMQTEILADNQLELMHRMTAADRGQRRALNGQFDERAAETGILLNDLSARLDTTSGAMLLREIKFRYDRFLVRSRNYRGMLLEPRSIPTPADTLSSMYNQLQFALTELKQSCFGLLSQNKIRIDSARAQLADELRDSLFVVALATLVAMILSIVGGSFYARWAINPIHRLTQAVKNLSGGQLGERVIITSADELGDLSFEFNRMLERLRRYETMNIEQLLLEKQKVETIVQSIATPILVVDAEMNALMVNTAAAELFRLDVLQRYDGVPVARFMSDATVLGALKKELAVHEVAGGLPRLVTSSAPEVLVVHEEGRERYYAIQALPLKTSSVISGVVAVFADITHFKELDRMKSEFLAKVSHEFRTPLASILMSIDILREGIIGQVNAAQRDLLESSKEDCRRLSKLIVDVLELSRLQSASQIKKVAPFELRSLIESVVTGFSRTAGGKGVSISWSCDDSPESQLMADPEDFRWVLNNLIGNAVTHTDSGGSVSVSASVAGDHLMIMVTDNGHGIPLESLGKIFEQFYQAGNSSISTPGSVGLGLAIAREVVQSYGGQISVTSELGSGSCFTVRIPLEALR